MSFGLYTAFLGFVFLALGIFFVYDRSRAFKINRESGYSTFITGAVLCGLGAYFLVVGIVVFVLSFFIDYTFVVLLNFMVFPVPQPLNVALFIFTIGIFFFIALYVGFEYLTKKYESEEAQLQSLQTKKVHRLDLELARKLYHTVIDGIIVCYLFVGELTFEAAFYFIEVIGAIGSNTVPANFFQNFHDLIFPRAGQVFVVFGLITVFLFIVLTDLLRVHAYRYYPLKPIANIYREKERHAIGPHVYLLTGGLFVAVLFPPIISMVAITVAALGDAMATIVGVTMGKRKVRPSHPESRKTWEGCIGGVAGAFGFSFVIFLIMTTVPAIFGYLDLKLILFGLLISAIGAVIMFLTDYYSPPLKVSDNIVNPILCAIAIIPIYMLFYPTLFLQYYTFGLI